ncbi:3-hydroxymethyl-3-methylglutaryl-coenzyme a lyase [Fusarium napiforme]|uniref:3-hydroxymethyl-3-methylglutaryl-coenzyme a lyase n=1 Tax=Fusarium napiforme TaxID=42672 RepID=A0A8H5IYG1_9HYPO|nr:3-hydroxymethyl-3-methylglutaryl-coenzyme a lyase [Fusarium napiforme]
MASVTVNPLAALAPQFGHPDLLQRLSTIEAQLAKLSEPEGQEQRFDFNQPFPTQQCDIPASPTQPRSSTYLGNGSDGQRRLSDAVSSSPEQAESITPTMPPDDVVQHLVDTYFTHVHNQPYAYFQEEHYRQLFSFMLLPKCLTFAILASSVRFSDHEYFSGRTHDAMEGYARQAWLCVLSDHLTVENEPNFHVAQTTNILAIIDFTAGRTSSGWLKIGLAVRICQDLQLMNEPNPMLPIVEQEERRRVFWSVYLLDKLVSCGRARPPAIADEDCHVQLPCEEEVFRTGTWKQTPTLHRLLNWDADLGEIRGYFTLAILVASALGRCARYVLHQREIDDTLPWDSRSEFAAINSFLLLIEQHLQVEEVPIEDIISQNKLPTGTPDHQVVGHAVFARIVFHLCHCLIGHPFLLALRLQNLKVKAPASFLSRTYEVCCDHASKIPSLLHRAQEAGCHVDASFYAYSTCVAGSILSMFIHGKESMGQVPSQQLLESGQHSLEILDKMGHFWDHAAKMHTQLLNFDTHSQDFEKMIDPHAVFDISPDLETVLWSMVDYGSMCGSSRTRSISPGDGQFPVNMNSPSFFNFDVNMTPRSFDLSGVEGINGARHTMRSYVMS